MVVVRRNGAAYLHRDLDPDREHERDPDPDPDLVANHNFGHAPLSTPVNRFDPVATWIAHTTGAKVLARVLVALQAAGIEPLPVKGIILARTLYEDVSQRPIQDIDLRVAPRELPKVMNVARAHGWPVRLDSREYGARSFPFPEMLVEVSTSVGPPGVCGLSIDRMRERATRAVEPFGVPHLVPELHDHALLLCVNVFKDKLDDALPWCERDLERIILAPGFDVERFVRLVEASRSSTLVWLVTEWAASRLRPEAAGRWRDVQGRLRGVRAGYVKGFHRLRREPRKLAVLLPVLARVVSDAPAERVRALALSAVGSVQYAAAHVKW